MGVVLFLLLLRSWTGISSLMCQACQGSVGRAVFVSAQEVLIFFFFF